MGVPDSLVVRHMSGPVQAAVRRFLADAQHPNVSRLFREYQSSAVRSSVESSVCSPANSSLITSHPITQQPISAPLSSRAASCYDSASMTSSVTSLGQAITSLDPASQACSPPPLANPLPSFSSVNSYSHAWPRMHGFSSGSRRGGSGKKVSWLVAGGAPILAFSSLAVVDAKEKFPGSLPGEVVLYQYEACPFCNKVKAYLDYHDIPYRVVEVNPLGKKELQWSEYKKVPVVRLEDQQLNDSTAIITVLENRLNPARQAPGAEAGTEAGEEARWRRWVDEHLVHLLSPNIYRTPSEAIEAFDYITTNGNFSAMQRAMAKYAGATSMYLIGKRLKKKYNIEDERGSLYAAANEWVAALGERKFLGGDKPNLGDLAVFGVLRPIRHMQAGRDMMANTAIGPWYERMEVEVGESSRINK